MADNKNPYVGKDKTPHGVLSPATAQKHGLTKVMYIPGDPSYRRSYRGNRKAKALFQMVKWYRSHAHNVNVPKLSNSLRLGVHYFLEPMARSTGYVAQSAPQDNDNSLAAVATPMKV
jgi:hypothetical protein